MLSIACRYWIQPISSPFSSYIHAKTQSTFMITWPLLYPRRHPYLVNQILWKTVLTKDCKLTETSTAKSHASWKTSSIYQCNIHGSCFEVVIVLRSLFSWQVLPRLANVVLHYPWPVGLSRRLVYTKAVNSMNKLFPVCKLILELEMMKIK
jgi:hypothetical protein